MTEMALEGIRVVEYATMVSGPYCGKLLSDLGADVIKVEPPDGDPAREAGPFPAGGPHRERSALFLYLNTSKRGVTLDTGSDQDLERFKSLIAWADILIDNHPIGHLDSLGLNWDRLQALNPKLVYTHITPYGRTGPRAGIQADELTVIHAGGLANLLPAQSTDTDFPPVKPGGYPVGYHGGMAAALAGLAAVMGRGKDGSGELIDISLQDVIINLVSPLLPSCRYLKTSWSRVPDRPPAMGRMQTSDGFVILGAADDHHFRAMRELMGWPKWAEGDEWDDMHYRRHHSMDIAPMMEEWMHRQKKDDIHHKAARKGIPIGPINSAKDVMESPQNEARGFFVTVDHPEAGRRRYAGWPYRIAGGPRVSRPAPLLGQHNDEIFNADSKLKIGPAKIGTAASGQGGSRASKGLPLEGFRVLDFSWVWAGPYATMILGDLGAEVIKIEGHRRMDLTRRSYPWPLEDAAPYKLPHNQGMGYNSLNMNKKSLTLDLSRPEGKGLARRLALISDVILDNMRPGVMTNLGLDYDSLKSERPDIITITSSSRGYSGPQMHYLGFASIHHAVGGGSYITGHPDGEPSQCTPGDVDIMNAIVAAYAVTAALYHRQRTGEGQFIDYSQCEGVSSMIGDALLGYEMTGVIPERMGNAHPRHAPHNVYRCWGVDRWLALEIHTDEEFIILTRIMNMPEVAFDPRFADAASRKRHEKELDRIVGAWVRMRDRDWMATEFCRAGLRAAPSRESRDLYADRHLRERGSLVKVQHPEVGELEMVGPLWKMGARQPPRVYAPLLGEHNAYVLGELLGLSEAEIEELRKQGIVM